MKLRLACAGLILAATLLETGCCCCRGWRARRHCAPADCCCSSPAGFDAGATAIYPSYRHFETASMPKSSH